MLLTTLILVQTNSQTTSHKVTELKNTGQHFCG